jgi:hypothetical protein
MRCYLKWQRSKSREQSSKEKVLHGKLQKVNRPLTYRKFKNPSNLLFKKILIKLIDNKGKLKSLTGAIVNRQITPNQAA